MAKNTGIKAAALSVLRDERDKLEMEIALLTPKSTLATDEETWLALAESLADIAAQLNRAAAASLKAAREIRNSKPM